MKVLEMPLTKRFGIVQSDDSNYLLKQLYDKKNLNHIDTLHASAIYSLAEITSGFFLKKIFPQYAENTIPILRSSNIKYKKACNTSLFSKAKLLGITKTEIESQLATKKKTMLTIEVKLYNEMKELVVSGEFHWFVTLK